MLYGITRNEMMYRMRITIYKNQGSRSKAVANILQMLLKKHPQEFIFDDQHPEVVISVGGDGTLLAAFQKYKNEVEQVRFIGVHTGHLGFYADWQEFELDQLVTSLLNSQGQTVQYPLLATQTHYHDGQEVTNLALNEASIKQVTGTLAVDVYLDGEIFERFRGDGLTAATPTGSTAYNKAIGGAVMHPSLASIQLAEIASINNRIFRTLGSPLVVGPDETIRIVPLKEQQSVIITHDLLNETSNQVDWIEFKVAKERISFVSYRHTPFWHRVRNSFIGDEVVD